MTSERHEQSRAAHKEKLTRILGKADKHADKDVKAHEKRKYHETPAQIAKIADHEIEMKGTPKKKRLDRAARKKGGRSGKGDVNIIIAQKPDQPQGAMPQGMGARPPMAPPPRPMMAPQPPQGAPMPPPGGGMPPGGPAPGGAVGIPPMMPRKRGGKAEHPDIEMHYGAGGGLARLEKGGKVRGKKMTALRTYKDQIPIAFGDIAWSESKKTVVTVTENNLGVSLDVTISANGQPDGSVPIADLVFLRRGMRV